MDELNIAPSVGTTPPRLSSTDYDRRSRALHHKVIAGPYGMGHLLKAMRAASGLFTRQIAERMGIQRESLNQYFWQRIGKGGTCRLIWFLRFAEATGCKVYVTFPSNKEQYELKLRVENGTPKA